MSPSLGTRPAIGVILVAFSLSGLAVAGDADPPPVETVATDLDFPTGIAFTPKGSMVVNERNGTVSEFGPRSARVVAQIDTTTSGETGLLGIALDEAGSNAFVFVTDPSGVTNSVVRVGLRTGETDVVVEGLPADLYHNGGGVALDSDGMLLVTNGEQHDGNRAQNPAVLGGKVYRFTPEGDVAPGNPFGDSPAYALGLRNPYGITVDPATGAVFVTENGPSSHDEINLVEAGGNYGWPVVSGPGAVDEGAPGDYHDPLIDHEAIVVPTGIAIADTGDALPEYAGNLFYGTYEEETIRRAVLNRAGTRVVSSEIFVDVGEPVVAVAWGPRGLYFSTPTEIKVIPIAKSGGGAPLARQRPEPPSHVGPSSPFSSQGWVVAAVLLALAFLAARSSLRRRD